jgi:hypothetical protein
MKRKKVKGALLAIITFLPFVILLGFDPLFFGSLVWRDALP